MYNDMMFCKFYKQCIRGNICPQALTKTVEKDSEKIGIPISIYSKKPFCFENKQIILHIFLGHNDMWAVKFAGREKIHRYYYYEDDAISDACLWAIKHKVHMILLHDKTGRVYKEIQYKDIV